MELTRNVENIVSWLEFKMLVELQSIFLLLFNFPKNVFNHTRHLFDCIRKITHGVDPKKIVSRVLVSLLYICQISISFDNFDANSRAGQFYPGPNLIALIP